MRRILIIGLALFALLSPAKAADSTVSAMTAAGAITGSELLYCVQSAADRKCTPAQLATYLYASPIFTGTVTMPDATTWASSGISAPAQSGSGATGILNLSQTWNTTGAPTALKLAVTNTASSTSSFLVNLLAGVSGTSSVFTVDTTGNVASNGNISAAGNIQGGVVASVASGSANFRSIGSGDFLFGGTGSATPVAQIFQMQPGAGTNIAGQNFTLTGSLSTGTATDGDLIFQTGVANGVSGTGAATPTTALTIKGETQQVVAAKGLTVASITGSTQCLQANTSGVVSGTGAACGTASTIASGASALGTAAIASATCATVVTASAPSTATTDVVTASFNGDPTAVTGYVPLTTGMLTIFAYPTAGNVNFKVCNNTAGSITPGPTTINWRVVR